MRTSDLDYELPPDRIASHAADPRDSARLMVVRPGDPHTEDRRVRDLPGLLRAGDVLVFNTTRVLPARLLGRRAQTGGKVEGLFLSTAPNGRWVCLLRAGHLREGIVITLDDHHGADSGVALVLERRSEDEAGAWIVQVTGAGADAARHSSGEISTHDILARVGRTPLPPYILKARSLAGEAVDDRLDQSRYQTVFAASPDGSTPSEGDQHVLGSVAAPTAGLHFTPELLLALSRAGVERVDVTLHVGTGTFRPVEAEFLHDHPMHEEWCSMQPAAAEAVMRAIAQGRRVIPVGTTAARTLESYAAHWRAAGEIPSSLATRILIAPGHAWSWCTGLMTNFHLPRSTLMAMVGSLLPGGVEELKGIYCQAIDRGYRFYSYGDAMLVLPG